MSKKAVFFLLFSSVFFFCGFEDKKETISVGAAAPLTGPQAYIGIGMMQGAQMAVEDANAKGPVFGNTKLNLVMVDDQSNPTQAVLMANKLIADPQVVGVVGHFNSSCTKPASTIYHEGRMAQITPASTNPEISRQGFDTFFRICATDDVQAPAAARFAAQELGVKKIAIIDDKTTYGVGLATVFEKEFKALGGTVLSHDGITQGEKDFAPLLAKVQSLGPELVYFGGVYPEMALLVRQAKKMGLEALWMGGDGIFDVTLIKLITRPLATGIYATMLGVDPHSIPEARDFVTRYEARYGEIGSFSAYGYEAMNVLIEAIRRAGKNDRQAVLAQIKAMKDYPGILGVINFDKNGDAIGKSVGVYKVEDGKFVFLQEAKA